MSANDKTPIELVWKKLEEQNAGLSEKLDQLYEKPSKEECWPYRRQRQRKTTGNYRPRLTVSYDGRMIEVNLARLILARHRGHIGLFDAAHICLMNRDCCNPDHLVALSRSAHMKMDKPFEAEIKRMREACPSGTIRMIVIPELVIKSRTALPEGWPTDEEMLEELNEKSEGAELNAVADAEFERVAAPRAIGRYPNADC
jgi:hypothetical protein